MEYMHLNSNIFKFLEVRQIIILLFSLEKQIQYLSELFGLPVGVILFLVLPGTN